MKQRNGKHARLECFPFPIPHLIKGATSFFLTSESEKKKGLKIKTLFSFRHSKYREPIYRLIPICVGINHYKDTHTNTYTNTHTATQPKSRQTAEDKAMLKEITANVAVDTLMSIKMLQQRVREVLQHMHLVN